MKNKRSLILLLFLLIGLSACNNNAVPQGNSKPDTTAPVANEPTIEKTPAASSDEPIMEATPPASSDEPTTEATPASSDEPTTEETPPASSDEPITEATPEPTETRRNDTHTSLYEDFLRGKINATDNTEMANAPAPVFSIKDIMLGIEDKYAVFDINNDGTEELLLSSADIYILSCQGGELFLWWSDHLWAGYSQILTNGDILYIRPGGAPTHTNYVYLVLDENGAEKERVEFYKYDSDEDGTFEDFYFENEEHISQEEWEQKTKPYLSVSEIAWKEYTSSDEPTETDIASGDYQFEVNEDGTITITKYIGDGGDVTIPAEIDGKKVTAIGNTFKEKGAFAECENLTSVVIRKF